MQLPKTIYFFSMFMQGVGMSRGWGALRALCKSDSRLHLLLPGTRSQSHIQVARKVGADSPQRKISALEIY